MAWHELGAAGDRPVILIHGLFSNALVNWVRYGHAAKLVAKGRRVIMPDLRAHGSSGKPHDRSHYPPDVLALDGEALVAHLALNDYDLGGYSMGARTCVRLVARGATPNRLILGGMGIEGIVDAGKRSDHFRHILENLGTFERGSDKWMVEAFLKTTKGDPRALLPLLGSFVDTPRAAIEAIGQPTLVVAGEEDDDNGSADDLARLLPNGRYVAVPGGHMSAVTRPDLGRAMANFLAA